MLGVGEYKANIDHVFLNGDIVLKITYKYGSYSFEIKSDEVDFDTDITILTATENGNTICAKAEASVMPGKVIDVFLSFDDNKCNGYFKVPYVGKIKIKDAVKL